MAAALTGASGCVPDATPKNLDAGNAPDGETIVIKLDAAPDRAPDVVEANAPEAGTLDVDRVLGILVRYLGATDERVARMQRLTELPPGR